MVVTSRTGSPPSKVAILAERLLPLMLVLSFLLVSVFNLLPEVLRLALTGAIAAYLVICVIAIAGRRTAGVTLGAIAFIGFLILNVISIPVMGRYDTLYFFSQYLFAFLASVVVFLPQGARLSRRNLGMLYLVLAAFFLICVAQAFLGPPLVEAGKTRLAVFNGGEEGLHPSAYAIMAYLIFFVIVHRGLEPVLRFVNIALGLVALVVLELYIVRTAHLALIVSALVYVLLAVGVYYRFPLGNLVLILVAFLIPAMVAGILYLSTSSTDVFQALASYSSGRTASYLERLQLFADRSFFDQFFGLGAGSDIIVGRQAWSWEAKDSHNDFLSFLLEFGYLGLLVFVLWCVSLLVASRSIGELALVSGLIVTSAVSNGVFLRPTLFILFVMAIAIGRTIRPKTLAPRGAHVQRRAWGTPASHAVRRHPARI